MQPEAVSGGSSSSDSQRNSHTERERGSRGQGRKRRGGARGDVWGPCGLPASHTAAASCPLATHSHTRRRLSRQATRAMRRKRACSPDAGRYRPHTAVGVSKSPQAVASRRRGRPPSPAGFPAPGQDSSSLTQTKTAELRPKPAPGEEPACSS